MDRDSGRKVSSSLPSSATEDENETHQKTLQVQEVSLRLLLARNNRLGIFELLLMLHDVFPMLFSEGSITGEHLLRWYVNKTCFRQPRHVKHMRIPR